MTLIEAIKILDYHNRWRRGEEIEMTNSKLLGEAIDMAIAELRKPIKPYFIDLN